MYEDLIKEKIIIDLKKLVSNTDSDLDSYADFMREVILNTYGVN